MTSSKPLVDTDARKMAQEARDLAIAAKAQQESHELYCRERHENLKKWQEDSQRARHELRSDMMGGFSELRVGISTLSAGISSRTSSLYNRAWTIAGALILILLGVVGFLVGKHGI